MGRRALRKIDPELDLSHYYSSVDEIDTPQALADLFEVEAPLELEVGSGKGLFIANASGVRTGHNFLGVEIAGKYARFSAARLAKLERTNAVMLRGDVMPLFASALQDNSLHAVHVYFPDPWWKARHHKRRIMNRVFLEHVSRCLVPGGSLHFWTDVLEYFDASLELIRECTNWEGPLVPAELQPQHDLDYQTHFERRTRMHEQPVYRSEFRKPS